MREYYACKSDNQRKRNYKRELSQRKGFFRRESWRGIVREKGGGEMM